MVEILYNRGIEKVEKEGKPNFIGKSSAKDMRGWIQGRINICIKQGLSQEEFFFRQVLNAFNHYNPIQETQVDIESWKGKSSFELVKGIDRLTIIKFQKKDKESEPKEIRFEITKGELISLVNAINLLKERLLERDYLESKEIAFQYCINMGFDELLVGDFWKNFFSSRSLHNRFTLMLDALEKLGLISYNTGKVKLLNKDITIQMIL